MDRLVFTKINGHYYIIDTYNSYNLIYRISSPFLEEPIGQYNPQLTDFIIPITKTKTLQQIKILDKLHKQCRKVELDPRTIGKIELKQIEIGQSQP
ncbi:MAG: hypothetical protein ABIN35_00590 [candidate division WOR-3 bacterium]